MLEDLSFNLILGKPWIHEIHIVPLTLHHKMQYVHNNKFYQIEMDPKMESFLQFEKGTTSPLNTLMPTSKIDPTKELRKKGNIMYKFQEMTRVPNISHNIQKHPPQPFFQKNRISQKN